jgi:hypothetical protein
MSVFHNLEAVPIEVNVAIKVHVMESLHWNLVASSVLELVGLILEGKVVFDRAAWNSGLFIFARTERRGEVPEANQDGNCGEGTKEDAGLQSSTDFPGKVCWDEYNEGDEEDVGKAFVARAVGW